MKYEENRVALVVMTDGRGECLARTLESADALLSWPFAQRLLIDDSGDPAYALELDSRYPDFERVHHPRRLGFAGAVASAWAHVGQVDFVFHLEDDFVFNDPVPLYALIRLLREHQYVAEVTLQRQPWNLEEVAAGGVVALHRADFKPNSDNDGNTWLEHQRFFSTNPSLYRAELTKRGWPQQPRSEGLFTIELLREDPEIRFAYWGSVNDRPLVTHIGVERVGTGY